MTDAPEPVVIPVPRHRAPEEELPTPLGRARHRAAGSDGARVRIAGTEERVRRGRHAAPEDDGEQGGEQGSEQDSEQGGGDPLGWLGFRFEPA